MKKILVLFLAVAMIFTFAACGNNSQTPAEETAPDLFISKSATTITSVIFVVAIISKKTKL